MSTNMVRNSPELAARIRSRRQELRLTIPAAARRAHMTAITWSRYESGSDIRRDKAAALRFALRWFDLDGTPHPYASHFERPGWSPVLADRRGDDCALAYVDAADRFLADLAHDLERLGALPQGGHLGMVEHSRLRADLPEERLVHYEHSLVYDLRSAAERAIRDISDGGHNGRGLFDPSGGYVRSYFAYADERWLELLAHRCIAVRAGGSQAAIEEELRAARVADADTLMRNALEARAIERRADEEVRCALCGRETEMPGGTAEGWDAELPAPPMHGPRHDPWSDEWNSRL